MKIKKLVYGVGVNDAGYKVTKYTLINGKQKQTWICPFYKRWKDMLARCYSTKLHIVRITYIDCTVCTEWHLFSKFRAWMETQDWEGKQLDKDLLVQGNKVYSPDTCVFVSMQVNMFLHECTSSRGEWPLGVCWSKRAEKFLAACNNPLTNSAEFLGYFLCPYEAHQAWLSRKLNLAHQLAALQTDERVAKALIAHYENYSTLEIPTGIHVDISVDNDQHA